MLQLTIGNGFVDEREDGLDKGQDTAVDGDDHKDGNDHDDHDHSDGDGDNYGEYDDRVYGYTVMIMIVITVIKILTMIDIHDSDN